MIEDPVLYRLDAALRRDLSREMRAELRLATRPLEKVDEAPPDRQRHFTAVIILDQFECEIDSGGYSCGRPQRAILHKDLIRRDFGFGKSLGQFGSVLPMRCHVQAIE